MFFSWYLQQIPPAVHAEPVDCTRSSSGRNNTELPRASRCSGDPFWCQSGQDVKFLFSVRVVEFSPKKSFSWTGGGGLKYYWNATLELLVSEMFPQSVIWQTKTERAELTYSPFLWNTKYTPELGCLFLFASVKLLFFFFCVCVLLEIPRKTHLSGNGTFIYSRSH